MNGKQVKPTLSLTIHLVGGLIWALLSSGATAATATAPQGPDPPPADEKLEEIVIIGTNIRGREEPASPVFSFDRDDIEATGFATTPQFIQHLPQNFSGGASEINGNLGSDGTRNVGGTGVNLRGLGNDSSLVLLNGHRVAPTSLGRFSDISTFPLSAMERIEVMVDGASAIYGSDAVGGVANFILRDNFEGAETQLRYGTTSAGGSDEILFGQTFGSNWESGHGLLAYEFYQRDPLFARDREVTKELNHPFSLFPDKESHTVVLAGSQSIGNRLRLSTDILLSERDVESFQAIALTGLARPDKTNDDVEQSVFGLTGTVDLGNTWRMDVTGAHSRSETRSESRFLDTGTGSDRHFISTISSLDIKADGSLFPLAGGDLRMAIGGHFRQETYEDPETLELTGVETDESRDVYGSLTELLIPLIGETNRRRGFERLELTLAARYENYSDFGSTTDPKIDLLWSPADNLDIHATWGTSFRAPLFVELVEKDNFSWLVNLEDPASPTGKTLALLSFGQNADLDAETATTWTLGFTFKPRSLPNFNVAMTYFDIDFRDRVDTELVVTDAFTNPKFASFINRNPSQAQIDRLLGNRFTNLTSTEVPGQVCCGPPADLTDPLVTVDSRFRNSAVTQMQGLDLLLSYEYLANSGLWRFALNGTYVLENLRRSGVGDTTVDIGNTPRNPADLRLRAALSWLRGDWAAHLFLNYTGSYEDTNVTPATRVDSWAPVDLNLSYNPRDDIRLSLTVNNLLDEKPPQVSERPLFIPGLDFDPNNANPLGRFVGFTVTKTW